MKPFFVDTSAFYALADRDDRHHAEACAIVERELKSKTHPFTTNYVVAETHVLILSRLGHQAARRWLRDFVLPQEQVSEADQQAARAIILRHADKGYSLTDATSFAVMRRSGVHQVFAFDVHFAQFGFELIRCG